MTSSGSVHPAAPDHRDEIAGLLAASIGPACHELRSPLAVVYGFAKMLQGRADVLREAGVDPRWIDSIAGGSERLDTMLDDLSRMGRITAGRIHPEPESFDVPTAVRDVVTSLDASSITVGGDGEPRAMADPEWFAVAVRGILSGLRYDEEVQVGVEWRTASGSVEVAFRPGANAILIDTDTSAATLGLNLARISVVRMGGSLERIDDEVVIRLPVG